MKLKDDNKLRLDMTSQDPLVFRGLEKVAVLLRNTNGKGYLIGICFESKDYEPIKISNLQEAVYKVKGLLKQSGVDCSV
jgi:hypothetical protein